MAVSELSGVMTLTEIVSSFRQPSFLKEMCSNIDHLHSLKVFNTKEQETFKQNLRTQFHLRRKNTCQRHNAKLLIMYRKLFTAQFVN
jgi:hypothetical protein